MPPKTRRTTSHDDVATEKSLSTDPKKQKLDNEYDNQKENTNNTNTNGNEFNKEYPLRSHDHDVNKEKNTTEKNTEIHKNKNTNENDTETETKEQEQTKTTNKTENTETSEDEPTILEKGKLAFYFRPKMDHDTVEDATDVQRFSFAMTPEDKSVHRLIIVGSKTFPEKGTRGRVFAFVEKVSKELDEINALLLPYDYDTKTKGERHQEGSRVAGEAMYTIIQKNDGQVHLAYVLDIPEEPTESQQAFNIEKEASLLCSVRNPTAGPSSTGARGLQSKQKAEYPEKLMEKFQGKVKKSTRFAPLDPEFLNYEGCELLFIATGNDPKSEFKDIMEELENEVEEMVEVLDKKTHHHPEQNIYKERKLDENLVPDATHELK